MPAEFPKRQHYIPKMLLGRFCDDEGRLWVGDKLRNKIYAQNPAKALAQTHLYTRHSYDRSPPSAEHEQILGRIENDAAPAIDKVVGCARRGEIPDLSERQRTAVQRFALAMARRTPESQRRVSRPLTDDDFYTIVSSRADQIGYTDLPPKDAFFEDDRWRGFAERIRRNNAALFAAGTDPHMVEEERKFIADTNIRFAVARETDKRFVIGSHGITIFDAAPAGGELAGTVLPIAPDVLIHAVYKPIKPSLLVIRDDPASSDLIDAVNEATTRQSQTIAGNSETLIRSLLP
ncbi:DUF4238 domain-containing protein [Candidatus Poriferisocius sp.]|uniref:DUF4238 domain-containing protein n=1 Tax=Candidatus Poriferisocius sp. TaxID=3101276 RepID=UPI003B02D9BD